MSFNRDNVTWQSPDGTWNLGFYTVHEGMVYGDDEDYDPEWDVDYDYESFEWVTTGHATENAARAAWKGANPGCTTIVTYSAESAERVAELDEMARRHVASRRAVR